MSLDKSRKDGSDTQEMIRTWRLQQRALGLRAKGTLFSAKGIGGEPSKVEAVPQKHGERRGHAAIGCRDAFKSKQTNLTTTRNSIGK